MFRVTTEQEDLVIDCCTTVSRYVDTMACRDSLECRITTTAGLTRACNRPRVDIDTTHHSTGIEATKQIQAEEKRIEPSSAGRRLAHRAVKGTREASRDEDRELEHDCGIYIKNKYVKSQHLRRHITIGKVCGCRLMLLTEDRRDRRRYTISL